MASAAGSGPPSGWGPGDHAKLKQMFASAKKNPETERKAVAAATKWFDRRVGPEAGTTRRVAYAGVRSDQGPEQMDCIDISRNNTSLLLVLDQMGLLKHHKVDPPRARGWLFDRWPHATAVLRETVSGQPMGGRQLDPQVRRGPRRHAAGRVAQVRLLSRAFPPPDLVTSLISALSRETGPDSRSVSSRRCGIAAADPAPPEQNPPRSGIGEPPPVLFAPLPRASCKPLILQTESHDRRAIQQNG